MAARSDRIPTLLLAFVGLVAGCATADGPRGRSAATDPACLGAESARRVGLGAALREDPPLPDQTASGWPSRDPVTTTSGEPDSDEADSGSELSGRDRDPARGDAHHVHRH